jgi:hypothetical protein
VLGGATAVPHGAAGGARQGLPGLCGTRPAFTATAARCRLRRSASFALRRSSASATVALIATEAATETDVGRGDAPRRSSASDAEELIEELAEMGAGIGIAQVKGRGEEEPPDGRRGTAAATSRVPHVEPPLLEKATAP